MQAAYSSPRLQHVRQQLDDLDSLLERMLTLPLDAGPVGYPVPHAVDDPLTETLDKVHSQAVLRLAPLEVEAERPPTELLELPIFESTADAAPAAQESESAPESSILVPAASSGPPEIADAKLEPAGIEILSFAPLSQADSVDDAHPISFAASGDLNLEPEVQPIPATVARMNHPDLRANHQAYPRPGAIATIEEYRHEIVTPSWLKSICIGINAGFDRAAESTGPLGRWCKSYWGRQLLGSMGMLFLVAAAALGLGRWFGRWWQ